MRIIGLYISLLIVFWGCKPFDGDTGITKIQFYNQSGASMVLGVYVESPMMAQRLGISQNQSHYGDYSYDIDNNKYLLAVDWRLSDYVYCREFPFYGSGTSDKKIAQNFREAFAYYGTDSISLPVATSRYNLWKWLETRNPLFLMTLIELSLQDLGEANDTKEIICNPTLGCCLQVVFESDPGSKAIGLFFHSESLGKILGADQTEFMSIIGTRWRSQELNCPLGFGNEKTFGEFFSKYGIDKITVLFAESEDLLVEWENSHDDNVLIGKQVYDLNILGTNQSMKKIIFENDLIGSGDGSPTHIFDELPNKSTSF